MLIKESVLRNIVKDTVTNILKEAITGTDAYHEPGEEDIEIDDTNIDIEPEEGPENDVKYKDKQQRARELIKSILAKQGYKGDALDREVDKRMGKNKVSANAAMDDSFFNNVEDVWVGGKNYGYVDSGVGYDGDFDDLYESKIENVVKQVLKEQLKK